MALLRYVRDPRQRKAAQERNPEFALNNTVRSLRAFYRTDAAIAKALLPPPLEAAEPNVFVQFAQVCMHFPNVAPVSIGAATVGIECSYEGVKGYYVLAMPMEGEFIVIGGRETFGEPKKIAAIDFSIDGDRASAAAIRHDIPFLQLNGRIGEATGPAEFTEYLYCHKALPSIRKDGNFDGDVFLTRLEWQRQYTQTRSMEGEIVLRESPYDPLVDVPVRSIVSMQYAEGKSVTSGTVLRTIPGEWLAPYIHQRYDDAKHDGIDVVVE